MGYAYGGEIQITGYKSDNNFEVQQAISYSGAPVYRQKQSGAWSDWVVK